MTAFSPQTLVIDAEAEIARIVDAMRTQLRTQLRRRGLVLGLSGGIDSSVCAALAARAVGPERVFALFMPENDSDPESLSLGRRVAETFGIASAVEDIGPALAAMGCYERRDSFIRQLVPEFGPGWGCKVVIANALAGKGYAVSSLPRT
jgi:NAD+ synthase